MKRDAIVRTLFITAVLITGVSANRMQWHKGQLHCHTTVSDGDVSPAEACRLYKRDGFSFVTITDHSTNTKAHKADTTGLNSEGFLAVPGLEITAAGPHVNAINLKSNLATWWGLQIAIDQAYKSGADLVQLNHPWWSNGKELDGISDDAMKAKDYNLLEVCNADDSTHVPDIAVWDTVLSAGRRIFGTGTDDAHTYTAESGHYNECWVMVPGDTLSMDEMMIAMKSGDFYFNDREMPLSRIDMYERTLAVYSEEGTNIRFIGEYGKVLKSIDGSSGSYTLPAGEPYVRAEVTNGTGTAYTQALFPDFLSENGGGITIPQGVKFMPGDDIPISLDYFAGSDSYEKVKIYVNESFIDEVSSNESSFTWNTNIDGLYRIKAKFYSNEGTYLWSNPVEVPVGNHVSLLQKQEESKYLNTFEAGYDMLSMHLESESSVTLDLYTLYGRKIATLVEGELQAGMHYFDVDGINTNNLFVLKAKIGSDKVVRKMIMK